MKTPLNLRARQLFPGILIVSAICWTAPAFAALEVAELSIEHLEQPLGIDVEKPRFSWVILSEDRDQMQSAYQVLVATAPGLLRERRADAWNSGRVESGQSVLVGYGGQTLAPMTRYWWKVRVWDANGRASKWSEAAWFETGLMDHDNWKAQWIRPDIDFEEYSHPSPLIRKEFRTRGTVKSARLYITSYGLYRAAINGKRVGDIELTPGWTSYPHRLQYQTYDVTGHLGSGGNAIGIMLGNGWYRAFRANNRDLRPNQWLPLALLAQLKIEYADGSEEWILTEPGWKSSTGPIVESEIYDGEIYDARLESEGWTEAGYDDSDWPGTVTADQPKEMIVYPSSPPMRVINQLKPIELLITPEGDTVIDMGQNMVGWVQMKVQAPAGTRITLRHAEVLDKEGNFYTTNLRQAKQRNIYYCRGNGGTEVYEPFFTFQGFRYVSVHGYPGMPELEDFTGMVVHSDIELTGDFSCNHELINQLQHNIQWGQKGNFVDVPTDCPQRNERLGWTGDAQAFAPTACFNMDCSGFYTKWLRDLAADQHEDGAVPHVIPNVLSRGGAHGWQDAATIVPWNVYRYYADEQILARQYESMKALVDFMDGRAGESGFWEATKDRHFGDWLAFATTRSDYPGATTDKDLLATAYFYRSTDLLQQSARILGKTGDAERYAGLMKKIRNAFADECLTPNGRLSSNTQTAYTVALSFGLIPEDLEANAAGRLAADVNKFGHLTTGFLGTPDLLFVLAKYGYLEEAYMLLYREKYPSWLYPVTMGATTIWERWDGIKPDSTFQNPGMNSFNHYAYGAVGDFLYRRVAGIDLHPEVPGFRQFIIKPHPGDSYEPGREMNDVMAWHESPYGRISSEWQIRDGKFTLQISIPVNTRAEVFVPSTGSGLMLDGSPVQAERAGGPDERYHFLKTELGSGTYTLSTQYTMP